MAAKRTLAAQPKAILGGTPPASALKGALPVTASEISRCIAMHEEALTNQIRNIQTPSSGAILTLLQTLDRLRELQPGKEEPKQ